MTAADLQNLAAATAHDVALIRGTAEQVRLRGLTAETFGLPPTTPHLIQKLRTLQATDPQLLATIRNKDHQ